MGKTFLVVLAAAAGLSAAALETQTADIHDVFVGDEAAFCQSRLEDGRSAFTEVFVGDFQADDGSRARQWNFDVLRREFVQYLLEQGYRLTSSTSTILNACFVRQDEATALRTIQQAQRIFPNSVTVNWVPWAPGYGLSAGMATRLEFGGRNSGQNGCYLGECPDGTSVPIPDRAPPPQQGPRPGGAGRPSLPPGGGAGRAGSPSFPPRGGGPPPFTPAGRGAPTLVPRVNQFTYTEICQTPFLWCVLPQATVVGVGCGCITMYGAVFGVTVPAQ